MKTMGLCKDLKFVDTSAQCDVSTKAAQISVYSARTCEDVPSRCDWNMQSFVIKLMPFHFDPFCAQADPSRPLKDQQFIRFKQDFVRDRLIAHIIAVQQCQYRTHCFALVLLGKHHARLLRWDRGGIVVTDRFDFRDAAHSHYLPKFLWLYDNLTEVQRGHDPTVSAPSDDEKQNAWAALHSRYPNMPVSVTDSFRKLEVHAHTGKRLYVVGDPYRSQRTPFGRDTEWFIAYGVTEGRLVYLKDSWCIDECGFMREGETYRRLHAHSVPFIPTLVCYGDVPGQNTMTHNYMDQEWCFGARDLVRYQHIRLVVNEISTDIRDLGMKGITMVMLDILQGMVSSALVRCHPYPILLTDVVGSDSPGQGYGCGTFAWQHQ